MPNYCARVKSGEDQNENRVDRVSPKRNLGENIKVSLRVRPLNSFESEHVECGNVLQVKDREVRVKNRRNNVFRYDEIFVPGLDSQSELFEEWAKPVVDHIFNGHNACLFAYGARGTGKTYTMIGTDNELGIIPRICNNLFKRLNQFRKRYRVSVSHFEVLNNKVYDLFSKQKNYKRPLKIREHPDSGPYAEHLSCIEVKADNEVSDLFSGEPENAKRRSNLRSHRIFTVNVNVYKRNKTITSKINLIDLASSEKASCTESEDKSRISINKSLLTLGNVLSALATCQNFVPYRDSTLTWLLREDLQYSQISMLATVSPACCVLDETLTTLRFVRDIGGGYFEEMKYMQDLFASTNKIFKEIREEWEEKVDGVEEELYATMGNLDELKARVLKMTKLDQKIVENSKSLEDICTDMKRLF